MLSVIKKAMAKLVGTAEPGDVITGKTFYNTSTKEIQTGTFAAQSKSVTPSASAQTVTPDSGCYLLAVTVSAMTRNGKKGGSQVIDLGSEKSAFYYATVYNGSGKVQGSNNSSSWTDLKTVTAPGSSGGFAGGISSGSGTATYRYFRISLSGYNNGQTGDCTLVVAG